MMPTRKPHPGPTTPAVPATLLLALALLSTLAGNASQTPRPDETPTDWLTITVQVVVLAFSAWTAPRGVPSWVGSVTRELSRPRWLRLAAWCVRAIRPRCPGSAHDTLAPGTGVVIVGAYPTRPTDPITFVSLPITLPTVR